MFKMSVVLGVFMLVLSVSLQGLWINHTKTISVTQLTDVRSASTSLGIDELTNNLWLKYQTTVRVDSTDVGDHERFYSNIFGFETIALTTFIRAINDDPESFTTSLPLTIPQIRTSLFNFNWHDFKLAIYS